MRRWDDRVSLVRYLTLLRSVLLRYAPNLFGHESEEVESQLPICAPFCKTQQGHKLKNVA